MNKTIKFLALTVAILINSSVWAEDVNSLQTFIKDFYNNAIPSYVQNDTPNGIDPFFFHTFKSTTVHVGIDGKVSIEEGNIKDFKTYLNGLKKSSDVTMTFTVNQINSIDVMEETGVGSVVVEYSLKKGPALMSKGKFLVSFVAVVRPGGWKLTYINSTEVENEKFIGTCVCELMTNSKNTVGSWLTVPDGDSYETVADRFEITKLGENRFIIVNGTEKFKWEEGTGTITYNGQTLGVAKESNWAIVLVLKHLQKERCNQVVMAE